MEDRYLFRSKRLDNGQWVQGNLVYSEDSEDGWETLIIPTRESNMFTKGGSKGNLGFENWYRVDQDTICQCTGLKDKNGNLIWENDILDGFTYPYMSDGVHNYYVEVCWCNNVPGFGIYTQKYPESKVAGISAGMTELMEDWDPNDWEVIGNIFDNPELLESEG